MRVYTQLFGIGAVLVLLSFIFFMAYRHDDRNAEDETEPLIVREHVIQSDEETVSRALSLGMQWPPGETAEQIAEPEIDDVEIIKRALALGMVFIAEAEPAFTSTPTPSPTPTVTPAPPAPTATPAPPATGAPTAPTATPAPSVEIINDPDNGTTEIRVVIRPGNSATRVARLLEAGGVISDANDFLSYMHEHRITRVILPGIYSFSPDTPYEVIRSMITRNR
ncbi:MAG: hypothetical protein FWE82_02315 [Defluviitaleaceae bacterium]|nr:hypothetical protein [Defluviitaleaceae bacterium]